MPHYHRRGFANCPSKKTFWKNHKGAVCVFCGASATTVDHKLALSKGGDHSQKNLAPACVSCNQAKGSLDFDLFLRYSKRFGPVNIDIIKNTHLYKLHEVVSIFLEDIPHQQKVQIVKNKYPNDWDYLLRRFNHMRKSQRMSH